MNSLLRFIVPAIAALVIMAGLLALSVWILERPAVAARIERLTERLTFAWAEEPETRIEPPAEPAPAPATPTVDCASEAAYLDGRIASARACRDDLDCVVMAPRQRCIVALRVGMAGAIEDDLLRVAGACADSLELPTLDTLCRIPDRGWVPFCNDGICALHDSFEPR